MVWGILGLGCIGEVQEGFVRTDTCRELVTWHRVTWTTIFTSESSIYFLCMRIHTFHVDINNSNSARTPFGSSHVLYAALAKQWAFASCLYTYTDPIYCSRKATPLQGSSSQANGCLTVITLIAVPETCGITHLPARSSTFVSPRTGSYIRCNICRFIIYIKMMNRANSSNRRIHFTFGSLKIHIFLLSLGKILIFMKSNLRIFYLGIIIVIRKSNDNPFVSVAEMPSSLHF